MRLKTNYLAYSTTFVFALWFGTVTSLPGQSADQSADTGTASPGGAPGESQNYQADLFTGRYTYSVPIKVAPARQGAEPKLAINYNSAGGNGWCGMGWSLDTGYIQRDTRHGVPIKWSTGSTNPLTQYDDAKGFIANFAGSQATLVRVGSSSQNPIVYRQQVDTAFLTYNYYANNHWEVVDKSGNTFYFGEGPTNEMSNPKPGWTAGAGASTFRWALDKVIDVNGNATYLRYMTDSNALYLTNIMYNGNINGLAATHEVDFLLTNRPDTNFTFISGCRVQSQKLLSEIDIKVSGANVRKYILGGATFFL